MLHGGDSSKQSFFCWGGGPVKFGTPPIGFVAEACDAPTGVQDNEATAPAPIGFPAGAPECFTT